MANFGNSYGNAYLNSGYDFAAIEPLDSDGDGFTNIAEITARTFPGDPNSRPAGSDTVLPTVSAFTIPATSTSLTVSITTFTATDNVGVTGYLVNESATKPAATAAGWTATAPTSYTAVTAGAKTLYAWAKDAAGNVSASRSASVTITLPDTVLPTVSAFTIPATSTSLTVSITSFTATDNVAVTGYLVNESATKPLATAAGWTASAPTSYTAASAGAKTLYAWAKDAAGNVSASRSASVTITVADTTLPTVSAFTIPATSTSLTVPITSFAATDNLAVTGFMVTESATKPLATAAGWTATAPASYTASTAGVKTLYAWAKDAAGNVSNGRSATVTITVTGPPGGKNILDFDGDGKTDIAVYRSNTGAWYVRPSSGAAAYGAGLGGTGFTAVPGDYDGDGKTDYAIYQASTGSWYIVPSSGASAYGVGWGGNASDKPVPGDYDGDGKDDIAVYRASNGGWYIVPSSAPTAPYTVAWGGGASDIPVPGDYDGDGKTDVAIYRPGNGRWYIIPSSAPSAPYTVAWGGGASDIPVPGDYDGDGKTDVAIYRPGNGGWYIVPSSTPTAPYGVGWGGGASDKPVPGDYDGDGKTDVAIYRPSNGGWYIVPSSTPTAPYGVGWGGNASDIPITELSP